MARDTFDHIFQPVKIGCVTLRNRLAVAPTGVNTASTGGDVTERLYDQYKRWAMGGWGLICVEAAYVRDDGFNYANFLGISHDKHVGGLSDIAGVIHMFGGKCSIQPMHGGRAAFTRFTGKPPLAPSDTTPEWPLGGNNPKPRGMTLAEVEELIDAFVASCLRAKKAGFDMVTLHAAHGFAISQFMSRYTNHRTDKYGELNAFPVELIKRIKKACGKDFPIVMRISGDEFFGDKGITLQNNLEFIPEWEAAGVDAIDLSAGSRETGHWTIPPLYQPRGCFVYMSEAVGKVTKLPRITVGRINDPRLAEKILADGKADIVAVCRLAICDAEVPKKLQEGRYDDIPLCIACDLCITETANDRPVKCTQNYAMGRYRWEYDIRPAAKPKRCLIVGAGIAGMEFARIAAQRGHQVTIYDKEQLPGGSVTYMSTAMPRVYTHELANAVKYLVKQLDKANVERVFGVNVTPDLVSELAPDVVVLASGSLPHVPEIPGIKRPNVFTLDAYLHDRPALGRRVVVIGGHNGLEVALSLRRQGHEVTILEASKDTGVTPYLTLRRLRFLKEYLANEQVTIITQVRPVEIDDQGVSVIYQDGARQIVAADSVVIALERLPNNALEMALRGLQVELCVVGDSLQPYNMMRAIHHAGAVAREI